jgi:serine/threonine protein kinase
LLVDALNHLEININTLNGLSSTLSQSNLSHDITHVSNRYEYMKRYFVSKIRAIPPETRRGSFSYQTRRFKIKFGELEWFWWNLPKLDQIKNKTRSELCVVYPDPGDGVIITEEIVERATSVLRRFRDAWIEVNENDPNSDIDKVEMLERMPKIAMVLRAMGPEKWGLFNSFIEKEVEDKDMNYDPYASAAKALSGDEAHYMASQFSRARARAWPTGGNLLLHEDEPLPLEHIKDYKSGQNSMVDKVKYLWPPHTEYARKKMRPQGDSQAHISNEIKNLKDLCTEDHGHHFVKYVKTYSRGDEIGVLLLPVANEDLSDFLRWCGEHPSGRRNYRPALLRSLGCLAYSLCYLHNVKGIRHRDVKPQNVLCFRPPGQQEEFMWSDFGLAYGFSEQGFSGTFDAEFRATPQYEAPEIDGKLGSSHGRSADVFSFGCLFLEVVSVLALDKDKSVFKIPVREFWNYKDNIAKLGQWARETDKELRKRKDKTLRKVLQMSLEMIKKEPVERKKIGDIALLLADMKDDDQLSPHPFCDRCVAKRQIDLSKNPRHKDIFVHRKKDWSTTRAVEMSLSQSIDADMSSLTI